MPHRFTPIRAAALLIVFLGLLPGPAVSAQGSAMDLVNAVNALRASYGLPAYSVDGGLMSFSQSHSEYQASIQLATHSHKDGTNPNLAGLHENVAVTSGYNIDYVVGVIWSDEIHMITMVGFQSGAIGAGVAVGDDGETYYTIDVRAGASVPLPPPKNQGGDGSPGSAQTPAATQAPIQPVVTATPRPNGFLVHEVGYGQTLWDIAVAYGVKIDDLRARNSMPDGSVAIYAGQKLLIRAPLPSTATAAVKTMTAAPAASQLAAAAPAGSPVPSATPLSTPTTLPPTAASPPTATAAPTRPPTETPPSTSAAALVSSPQALGIGLIVACAIGLVALAISGRKKM